MSFSVPKVAKRYLLVVGQLLEITGGGFAFEEEEGEYMAVEIQEGLSGETAVVLGDILDRYGPKLTSTSQFVLKSARSEAKTSGNFTYMMETYVSTELSCMVYLLSTYNSSSGNFALQVEVLDYLEVPAYYNPVIELFGLDPSSFRVEAPEGLTSETVWTQVSHSGKTLDEIMQIYTDILDADTTFGFTCISPVTTVQMTSGDEGRHCVYACEGFKVELYAFDGRGQISISKYSLPPQSDFADAALAFLEGLGYTVAWDSDSKFYSYGGYRPLETDETISGVVKALVQNLLRNSGLGLRILQNPNNDLQEVIGAVYSQKGGISIKYSTHYGATPVLFIKVFAFEDNIDIIAALSGLVMSAPMSADGQTAAGEDIYSGLGEFNWTTKHNLKDDGKSIMDLNIALILTDVISLGYTLVDSGYVEDENGNTYVANFTNEDGYKAQIILYEDADGNYAGYYKLVVIVPVEE